MKVCQALVSGDHKSTNLRKSWSSNHTSTRKRGIWRYDRIACLLEMGMELTW